MSKCLKHCQTSGMEETKLCSCRTWREVQRHKSSLRQWYKPNRLYRVLFNTCPAKLWVQKSPDFCGLSSTMIIFSGVFAQEVTKLFCSWLVSSFRWQRGWFWFSSGNSLTPFSYIFFKLSEIYMMPHFYIKHFQISLTAE